MGQMNSAPRSHLAQSKEPPFTDVIPPPKNRRLDLVQQASYELHASDLQEMQKATMFSGRMKSWANAYYRFTNSTLVLLVRSFVKTIIGIVNVLLANPSAPLSDPIAFFYGVIGYTVIYTALILFQWVLFWFDLFGGETILRTISNRLTPQRLSFVNWNASDDMFSSTSTIDSAKPVLSATLADYNADRRASAVRLVKRQGTFDRVKNPEVRHFVDEIKKPRHKYFQIDIARAFLLFSAAMYEREDEWVKKAADYPPWALKLLQKSEEKILDLTDQWNVRFASVSDFTTVAGAYAGAFYSAEGEAPWICVCFKGTSPTNYAEWLIDASLTKEPAKDYLWGSVHGGFYNKLFPAPNDQILVSPYRRIVDIVNRLAKQLQQECNTQQEINVWVSGHSLGAGLASVFYARALKVPMGPRVVLRDAFCYGCPSIGDAEFLANMDNLLHDPANDDRTFWKVTNDKDVVARVPPGLAGTRTNRDLLATQSLLNYGPCGIEIRLQPNNERAPFYSISISAEPGTTIEVVQDLNEGRQAGQNKFFGTHRAWYHPVSLITSFEASICPWLADHAPPSYWDSLIKISGSPRPIVEADEEDGNVGEATPEERDSEVQVDISPVLGERSLDRVL